MAANLCNALFAINAARSSNSFWREINVIWQNNCVSKCSGRLHTGEVCSVGSHPFLLSGVKHITEITRLKIKVPCNTIEQPILHGTSEFVSLVQEGSSVMLIDNYN